MISIEEAWERVATQTHPLGGETVSLRDCVGRWLLSDVLADVDSPPHRKSIMDGFAVRSADVNAGWRRLKVIETVTAGNLPRLELQPGQATRIMTGAPLPANADAVVMVELSRVARTEGQEWVELDIESIAAGKHVMARAENFAQGGLILEAGQRLRAVQVGLLAEVGATNLHCGIRPSVAVLPTGDELVEFSHTPAAGQIRNSNGPMLVALCQRLGLPTTDLGIGRDDRVHLEALIRAGLQHDVLLLSGGVSQGMLDLVPGLLKEAGVQEVFHRVTMKPGKPVWFGVCAEGRHRCHVFGLPGNPVSSLVGFHLFVRLVVERLEGNPITCPGSLLAKLQQRHEVRGDRPTFWPGRWVVDPTTCERWVAPLRWNGSSDLLALNQADGLIFFPATQSPYEVGETVAFYSL